MSKTIINKIDVNGEITTEFEVYINNDEPVDNLVTSLMRLHKKTRVTEKEIRAPFYNMIIKTKNHAFFSI